MGDNIKVSAVIAVYNAEKFLRQCLTSVTGQTLRDIEIICINDGSADSSLSILNEFAENDNRISIYSKENEGVGGAPARNFGLSKAAGEYVSILDCDDYFEPDMLEKAVLRADETGADIVVFGGCEHDDRNGCIHKVPSILNNKVIPPKDVFSYRDCPRDIFQLTQGMAWNKLFRRSFLEKHSLQFQNVKYTDDAYFTFAHMVLAERIAVFNECLCYYRVNTGTNQTAGLADYPDSAYLPYLKLKESLVEWGIYDTVKQSFVNCAVSFFRYFHDRIDRFEPFKYLHDKFRDSVFHLMDASTADADFFYDERVYLWVRQIMENTAEELIFKAAGAYGDENRTAILRFQFPYSAIERGSKIVIMGAGIMGRHFYSQIMLNDYCDIVMWVDHENKLGRSYIRSFDDMGELDVESVDHVLIAYASEGLIDNAVLRLRELGVPESKIVFGGKVQ